MFKLVLSLTAGIIGIATVGLCVYYDNKRRADPDYKKKVHLRRSLIHDASIIKLPKPDMKDSTAVERYFLQELHLGESCILHGDTQKGVQHLCNAAVITGQPARLLLLLQYSLSPEIFLHLAKAVESVDMGRNSNQKNTSTVGKKTVVPNEKQQRALDVGKKLRLIDELE